MSERSHIGWVNSDYQQKELEELRAVAIRRIEPELPETTV